MILLPESHQFHLQVEGQEQKNSGTIKVEKTVCLCLDSNFGKKHGTPMSGINSWKSGS